MGKDLVSGVSWGVVCQRRLAVLREVPVDVEGVAERDEACSASPRLQSVLVRHT